MNHVDRQHAKYGSSRIHRVRACAGYVALAARTPRVASEAADEGTEAHEFLAYAIKGGMRMAQDRFAATKDMIRGAEMVLDFLEGLYISHGPHLVTYVEERVVFPQDVVPQDDAAGIADLMVFDHIECEGWAVEYKFGHVYVNERRNPQLLFNSVAKWWAQPIRKLNLVVIQPNGHGADPVRTDIVGAVEMAEFHASTVAAIAAAESPGGALTPGTHCRFCECELTCPARERQAVSVIEPYATAIEQVEGLPLPPVVELGMDRLAYILRHGDELRAWLNAADREALRRAMEGQPVPEHKLVAAQARRSFPDDVDGTAAALSALTGGVLEPDDFTEKKLLGVTKVEAMLTEVATKYAPPGSQRQAAKDILERLAFLTPRASSGNLVLAHMSDTRPAVNRITSGFAGLTLPAPPT
jgi:hypothetical protein